MSDVSLLDAMEFIDADIIEEAEYFIVRKKKDNRLLWRGVAVGLCLIVAVVSITLLSHRDKEAASTTGEVADTNSLYNDNQTERVSSSEEKASIADVDAGADTVADADAGVYIRPIEIPREADGVMYDMIGMVVYRGGIYTQSYNFYGDEAHKVDHLIGAYLGYAKGNIDEWASQDDLAVEFASSIEGEIYEVIGYDTSFRICVRWECEDGSVQIEFLDRLNDITLTTGEDLFETRLHLRNHIANIQWQSHYDWNYVGGNIQNATIDNSLWEEFLSEVYAGYFVDTWDENIFTDPTSSKKSIYDTGKQAHIILTMDDGTIVQLRMIEGGYVGYDALGWYFVHIPGELFDAVFEAMGGNS